MLVNIVTISKHRSFFVQQSETINNFEITTWFITFVWKAYWNYNTYHHIRRVWRYQRGNQNPYIEEEQTTHWSNEKGQKDKQRSTKHMYKTKHRVTGTPLKTRGELRCSGRVDSSCS